jgi:hypothetical protein
MTFLSPDEDEKKRLREISDRLGEELEKELDQPPPPPSAPRKSYWVRWARKVNLVTGEVWYEEEREEIEHGPF